MVLFANSTKIFPYLKIYHQISRGHALPVWIFLLFIKGTRVTANRESLGCWIYRWTDLFYFLMGLLYWVIVLLVVSFISTMIITILSDWNVAKVPIWRLKSWLSLLHWCHRLIFVRRSLCNMPIGRTTLWRINYQNWHWIQKKVCWYGKNIWIPRWNHMVMSTFWSKGVSLLSLFYCHFVSACMIFLTMWEFFWTSWFWLDP